MNKNFQGEVSQQAALFLKLLVNQNWSNDETPAAQNTFGFNNKENLGAVNAQQKFQEAALHANDKQHLMASIFDALDNVVHLTDAGSKVIISSIENIIYNVAQTDWPAWQQTAQGEVHKRLTANDERA